MTDKKNNAKADLVAITDEQVDAAALFLHQQMNSRFSQQEWARCLRNSWADDAPNCGFMLLKDGDVVGAICALYSEQEIKGQQVKVCNPHSWVVLPEYRSQSVALVLAVIKQSGYHFTMFTPNQDGLEIFAFLRFKPLEKSTCRTFNFPTALFSRKVTVAAEQDKMLALLDVKQRQILKDHLPFTWIKPLVFDTPDGSCLMMLKTHTFKRLKAAQILYHSNSDIVKKYWPQIRTHLVLKQGLFSTKFEKRLLGDDIRFWHRPEDDHQRFYMSDTLAPEDIQYLYSEMLALDL